MNRLLFILSFLVFISGNTFGQSTNSSMELLREGSSKRKAKIENRMKSDKQNYWLGKVPVKDGIVTFERTINVPNKSKEQIHDLMVSFANQLVSSSEHPEVSQISVNDNTQGIIIGSIQETMYFKRTKWETDYTEFYYQFTIDINDTSCKITINNIQYRYEEQHEVDSSYLKAENWITDDEAFNKSKTKFLKEPGKFRRETFKRINEIFDSAEKSVKSN